MENMNMQIENEKLLETLAARDLFKYLQKQRFSDSQIYGIDFDEIKKELLKRLNN